MEMQKKADDLIGDIWSRVEEKYGDLSFSEQVSKFKAYKIQFCHHGGVQLNVFD
jgi:hypothetical protein